ncbi:hypothetical protein CP532_2497, partial [Ophiocordyceps camponoti-leonardi (nom. inval.)]
SKEAGEQDNKDPGFVYLITTLEPSQVLQAGGFAPRFSPDLPDEAYGYATFDERGGPWILLYTATEASRILASTEDEAENAVQTRHVYEIATGPHMVMRHPDPDRNTGFWTAAGIVLSQIYRHTTSESLVSECRRRAARRRYGCHPRHLVNYRWETFSETFNPRWNDYRNSGFQPSLSGYRDDHPIWRFSNVRTMMPFPPVRPSRRDEFFLFMRGITENEAAFSLLLGWRNHLPLPGSRYPHLAISSVEEGDQVPQFPWEAIPIPDETLRKTLSDGLQTETECGLAIALIVAIWQACPARRGAAKRSLMTAEEEEMLSNAVRNLKKTSSSCKVSSSERPGHCEDGLDSLQVYFDRSNAVTPHEISLAFDDGPAVYRLKSSPSSSSSSSPGWKEVDLSSSRQIISIDKVKYVSIIDSTHTGGPKTEWRGPHSFKLRAKCKHSPSTSSPPSAPQTLDFTKYATPKSWSLSKQSWSIKRALLPQTVGTFPLQPQEWLPHEPPCPTFKRLDVYLKLSDDIGAGTYDSLSLAIGGRSAGDGGVGDPPPPPGKARKNVFLVESPSRDFDMWKSLDLRAVFGSDTVDLVDIRSVALVDTAFENDWFSRDEWKIDHIKLKGYCASSPTVAVVEKSSPIDEWQAHGNGWGPKPVWSRDISLDDWHEI